MNRRTFTQSCLACAGAAVVAPLLSGCQSTYYTQGTVETNGLSVAESEFTYMKKDQPVIRQYIIVRNDRLEYPIYLRRNADKQYAAVLMKCTHQGATLNAGGDYLTCPSHGSEFTYRGEVAQGPAEENLRVFPVTVNDGKIFIDLRS